MLDMLKGIIADRADCDKLDITLQTKFADLFPDVYKRQKLSVSKFLTSSNLEFIKSFLASRSAISEVAICLLVLYLRPDIL